VSIWVSGGWCMPPIAITALIMFALGVHVYLQLRAKGFRSVSEKRWRLWIDQPQERKGPIGQVLDFVCGATSVAQTALFFKELRSTELAPFDRDLRLMKVCVSAAPLLGLLGTVTGMLFTFDALSTGSGGQKTMGMIAMGISEALVTTEAGLVVALPGLFFHHQLIRKRDQYKAFLAHVETLCAQSVYVKQHGSNEQQTVAIEQVVVSVAPTPASSSSASEPTSTSPEAIPLAAGGRPSAQDQS